MSMLWASAVEQPQTLGCGLPVLLHGETHNCEVRRRRQHKACTGILHWDSAGALPADRHPQQAAASCLEETNLVGSAELRLHCLLLLSAPAAYPLLSPRL